MSRILLAAADLVFIQVPKTKWKPRRPDSWSSVIFPILSGLEIYVNIAKQGAHVSIRMLDSGSLSQDKGHSKKYGL